MTIQRANVRTSETISSITNLLGGKAPTAISIDGPLVRPNIRFVLRNKYRACERNISGGIFQKRCKPGATNSKRGFALHIQSTSIANFLQRTFPTAKIVEAFPNAFLGMMLPDSSYSDPIPRGIKSDVFWEHALKLGRLQATIELLFPRHATEMGQLSSAITDHDERAAFICALTARAAELGIATKVGDAKFGQILLPPAALIEGWASAVLGERGVLG